MTIPHLVLHATCFSSRFGQHLPVVLGIDGCREGWVAVGLDRHGSFFSCLTTKSLADLFSAVPEVVVAGADMPLHLLDAPRRPADLLVRKALGPERGRSVFPALPRFAIDGEWLGRDYHAVNEECRTRYGAGFSRQSFALREKSAELNEALGSGYPVIEVHPEFSFATANGGKPLKFYKKSWGGQRERLALLARHRIILPEELPDSVSRLAPDDLIDAAVAAWSAHRYRQGTAQALPAQGNDPAEPRIWA